MYELNLISNKTINRKVELIVSIHNRSDEVWTSGRKKGNINLIAWWTGQNKERVYKHLIFNDFKPGDVMEYKFILDIPYYLIPGTQINIDLKKEEFYWFRDKLNEDNFIKKCVELIDYLPKEFPIIDKNSKKKSLLVETRELDHNEFVIKNTIQKLGDGWGHIIYCHKNNHNQIKSICKDISKDIEIRLLDFELTRDSYNNLCLDINFWKEIDCDKVLIYQTDTFICKDFDDKFLECDYIGAPWGPGEHSNMLRKVLNLNFDLNFGNGGLSLRSKSKMLEALSDKDYVEKYLSIDGKEHFKLEKIPEDLFFSLYVYKFGKYLDDNSDFSIELVQGIYKLNLEKIPFGYHKLDKFTGWEKVIYSIYKN
jgi:hypothetical protein